MEPGEGEGEEPAADPGRGAGGEPGQELRPFLRGDPGFRCDGPGRPSRLREGSLDQGEGLVKPIPELGETGVPGDLLFERRGVGRGELPEQQGGDPHLGIVRRKG